MFDQCPHMFYPRMFGSELWLIALPDFWLAHIGRSKHDQAVISSPRSLQACKWLGRAHVDLGKGTGEGKFSG